MVMSALVPSVSLPDTFWWLCGRVTLPYVLSLVFMLPTQRVLFVSALEQLDRFVDKNAAFLSIPSEDHIAGHP